MRSPFPGMDPYLERHWRHVHHAFINDAVAQMQPRLPKSLRARMEERVYVEPEDEPRRPISPDVRVIERSRRPTRTVDLEESNGGVAVAIEVAEPVVLEYANEPIHETIVRIIDIGAKDRVVTIIEFVSPTNKLPGDGKRLYMQKRKECFDADVNYVEIDLTRAGDRYTDFLPFQAPRDLHQAYQAWARRAVRPTKYEIYPLSIREKLPGILIPLRESDPDVPLALQPLVDQCYRNGGFDDIDYSTPPDPALTGDDEPWADGLLRAAGKR